MDENDLLSTNQYLPSPVLKREVSQEFNEEFRKYYKKELEQKEEKRLRDSLDRLSIRSFVLDEDSDANSLMNTNKYEKKDISTEIGTLERRVREVKTYVSVDSRDRDKVLFPKPNNFKIFLGKTFYNVKTIRLASIEFPNTNAVINSTNHHIYWRNKQDIDTNTIDTITGTYPVYQVQLRIGSYIANSLQSEITNKLSLVRRKSNSQLDFHYFIVDLDIDTDIVTFTSLLLTQTGNNPFSVTAGVGTITVTLTDHGYQTGDKIYIVGAKTLAGIPASTLGGYHIISRINKDQFQYEVNIKASENTVGGGNTVKTGVEAPFQLLFGEQQNTVAQNIGFPNENSSQRIDTQVESIQNIHMVQLEFTTVHGLTNSFSYIGQTCVLSGIGVSPNIDGNRVIARIINNYTVLVIVNSNIEFPSYNSGTFTFGGLVYSIAVASNYATETLLVTTFTNHNYLLSDIGANITLYDTITTPNLDGTSVIYGVLSDTQLIIPGNVLPNGGSLVTVEGEGGNIPRYNPLETSVLQVVDIIPGVTTRFTCPNHNLRVGEKIKFDNVITVPSVLETAVFEVYSIPDPNNFIIDFSTTGFDPITINDGTAKVLTKIVTVSFPNHGFNNIINIQNGYSPKTITSIVNSSMGVDYRVIITTSAPHMLTTGDIVTIAGTNSVPDVNGTGISVIVLTPTTFEIVTGVDIPTPGNTGQVTLKDMKVSITTFLPHELETGDTVRVMKTNCFPKIDGGGYQVTRVSSHVFEIVYGPGITTNGTSGIIGMNHDFFLYGAQQVGGIANNILNSVQYNVREIIDENSFSFLCNEFATLSEKGGGSAIYISSLLHGFSGVQTNTKNSLLNRSINLEGENYAFLCCPQLATMMNTGNVNNVFARITLDQSPGSMVFNYLSNPKEFDTAPLDKLSELEFSIVNYDNTLYEFNDLDYSFVLEITELKDVAENFNFSSRRGVVS